jgi:nucleotide-binding universal stress UspA family protein
MEDKRTCDAVRLQNILWLTDFSGLSKAAFRSAKALANVYGAKIHALHAVVPDVFTCLTPDTLTAATDLQEQTASGEMQRLKEELNGLLDSAMVARGRDIWSVVEKQIKEHEIDLMALGTHGRKGFGRLMLGSCAEQIIRRSPVPVVVVGPVYRGAPAGGRFQRIVFPSDLTPQSLSAAPYALSVARENQAELTLLYIVEKDGKRRRASGSPLQLSVAEALHRLHQIVPAEVGARCRADTVVEHGEPAARILETAKAKNADLIVLGVRGTDSVLRATHLENTVHQIIARSSCPVLTFRAQAA